MDVNDTTITWTSSPAHVPQEVEDQVDFLLNLSNEDEYVKLVELAADVNVRPMMTSNCDSIQCHILGGIPCCHDWPTWAKVDVLVISKGALVSEIPFQY